MVEQEAAAGVAEMQQLAENLQPAATGAAEPPPPERQSDSSGHSGHTDVVEGAWKTVNEG